jgi:ElaB/YqjD/DUF883 family membrane-anchored ribosome-binding protein
LTIVKQHSKEIVYKEIVYNVTAMLYALKSARNKESMGNAPLPLYRFIIALALIFVLGQIGFTPNAKADPPPLADPIGQQNALGPFSPDSPFYPLQRFIEWLRLQLTLNPLERAKYELTLMERRAEEIRDLAQRGRLTIERVESLRRQGEAFLNSARERIDAAAEKGIDVSELTRRTQTLIERQQNILRDALEQAPAETQNFIQRAAEAIRTSKEWILNLIERIPLPER